MKQFGLVLMICSLLMSASCNSKKEETKKDDTVSAEAVPALVKSNFSVKYPTAADIVWETAHEGDKSSFKAKFMHNGKKWKAEFGDDGVFIKEKEDN